jgi:sialic acid synthase SpsE
MFGNPVGFSDHTNGIHIACAAVALGANVIEKHFTLSRDLDTPDSSSFASDAKELAELVKQIRDIEAAKNNFSDRLNIQPEEKSFKESIAYKIIAQSDIHENEIITEQHLQYL